MSEGDHDVRPGYRRVIPRDLFNESSLLKNLGRLSLLIEDGFAPEGLKLVHRDPTAGFRVEMSASDGSICCPDLTLYTKHRASAVPSRPLNSRDEWPLLIEAADDETRVFDDDGNLSTEFVEWAEKARR